MIHFQHPQLLYLLLIVPALIGIYVWVRITRKRRLARFADENMFQRLTPEVSRWRPICKSSLALLAFALLIVALANPQVGSKMVKGERVGSDIAICFDISNSMMAEDIQPNRLERSKRVVVNLMSELAGDRISLIVFAGSSYIQMPLTNDYSAAQLFLDQINCEQISVQGTAIGDAIEKGMETFGYGDPDREWEQKHGRAIIVISDGENFEDDACAAAAKAHDEGILVCTIGMGLPEGVPIPEYRGGQPVGYKHDAEGNTITTRLNEPMLTDIAHAGDGIYVRGANINAGLHDILKEIEKLEKSSYGESMFSEYESRYYYPLAAALLCLVAELLLLERRNRKIDWSKLLRRDKQAALLLLLLAAGGSMMAQQPSVPADNTAKEPSWIARQMRPSQKNLRQGNQQYRKKHYESAESHYRKALDRDSNYYKSQYNLGNSLYRQERYDEAIKHYSQALQCQHPLSKKMRSNIQHNLGNSHLQAGLKDRPNGMEHFQQAVLAYQNALTQDPMNEDTRYNLSYAKKLLQQAQQNQNQQGQSNQKKNQQGQNKDQQGQNKDQNKDQQGQNKDQQGQNKNQQGQNKDQQGKQGKEKSDPQQQRKQQQKKEQAEQMLKAVENNEKNTMKDQYRKLEVGRPGKIEKDW